MYHLVTKKYVGITCAEPKRRWLSGHGYKQNNHFSKAIKKYGWRNFQHIILCENVAEILEQYYIWLYKSNDREFGYNIEGGGHAKKIVSEETKKKIIRNNKKANDT